MRMERSEPILPARDLDETRAFYEKLGFTAWFGGSASWKYEIVSRGHLVVHFFEEPTLNPSENNTSCYWRVKDADEFYSACSKLGLPANRLTAPMDRNWGMREFAIVDPSGNLIRVGHDLDADAAYVPKES